MPNQYTMKILFMIDQSWFDTVGINIFCNKLGQNLEKLGSQQKNILLYLYILEWREYTLYHIKLSVI